MRGAVFFLVVVTTLVAFVVRTLVVLVSRRRWPAVAAAADRWWPWTALVVLCLLGSWWNPYIGLPATVVLLFILARPETPGSPFPPWR